MKSNLLPAILLSQCCILIWFHSWFSYCRHEESEAEVKYVGLHLNNGRMGNQLFHLITGYAIAKTLGRVHYLPYENDNRGVVNKYLNEFKRVFPLLQQTYILEQNGINATLVEFAGKSCCTYDNPIRLLKKHDKYLLLDFSYAQNPRYLEQILPEVREILQFSPKIIEEGDHLLNSLKVNDSYGKSSHWHNPQQRALCIHIRRTDFLERNISTDMVDAVTAATVIAKRKRISRFMLFGDDKEFMYNMSQAIVSKGDWEPDVVCFSAAGCEYENHERILFRTEGFSLPAYEDDRTRLYRAIRGGEQSAAAIISKFSEAIDFYVASQVCSSFLITAVTSTFGWWLAFFVADQNSIYYMPDDRIHGDKVPSKELFLKSWQMYTL